MHPMLCLRGQSSVFINSGARSLASPSRLIMQPTSPWRWPNVTPIAPVASAATSTGSQLMNTLLKKVCASMLVMWEFEQWIWESSQESGKQFESQALSNRKSSYSVQEKITKRKKAKDICGRMRLSEKSVNSFVCVWLCVCVFVCTFRIPNRRQLWFCKFMGCEGSDSVLSTGL